MSITKHLLDRMRHATRHLLDGKKTEAAAAIREALQRKLDDQPAGKAGPSRDHAGAAGAGGLPSFVPDLLRQLGVATDLAPAAGHVGSETESAPLPGQFLQRSYKNAAGTRAYKVYVPHGRTASPQNAGALLPVVVMLHGCTQNPDDFAAGTKMNAIAEREGCLVVYPAQSQRANHSRCWNWFSPSDQRRDSGEPSLIAGITKAALEEFGGDPKRVYVAGLSAGGAMALIMGMTYPELYAAVGVHSGLPYGSAHDVQSAFAAMHGDLHARAAKRGQAGASTVRTIVFHGDRDTTVHPVNANRVLEQTAGAPTRADPVIMEGQAEGGRKYTRTLYRDALGHPVSEQWTVHGAGHAWSGGSARGSYTDPSGPDAGEEMMRFFHLKKTFS